MGGPSSSGKSTIGKNTIFHKATNTKEVHELGAKVTPTSWFNKIKGKLADAVTAYTGHHYDSMNDYLRGKTDSVSDKVKTYIKDAKAALKTAKLHENITVYRGANIASLGKAFDPGNLKSMVGAIIQDKGFMSTSLHKDTAFGGTVTYEIHAKKGSQGAFVKPISSHSSENEVLFNAGTKMKIKSIKPKGSHGYNIVAEII